MDNLDGTLEGGRDRVSESADEALASLGVGEGLELGVEKSVGLADGSGDREPVTSDGGSRSGEAVLSKPFLDSGISCSARLGEFDDLWLRR